MALVLSQVLSKMGLDVVPVTVPKPNLHPAMGTLAFFMHTLESLHGLLFGMIQTTFAVSFFEPHFYLAFSVAVVECALKFCKFQAHSVARKARSPRISNF